MISIATWNVQRPSASGPLNERRLSFLKDWVNGEHAPEIWVLTETRDVINLGEGWYSLSSFPIPGYHRDGETLVTIWSRWSIRPVSVSRFTACAEINIPGLGCSLIYGTVIPWDKDRGPTDKIGTTRWEEHYRQVQSQTAEWITLGQSYPDHFKCIAGDFNQHRGSLGSYRDKRSVELVTGALETTSLQCVTVDPIGYEKLTKPIVDHICISREVAMDSTVTVLPFDRTPVSGLSDHHLVVVSIQGEMPLNRPCIAQAIRR